mgnify:FL=1
MQASSAARAEQCNVYLVLPGTHRSSLSLQIALVMIDEVHLLAEKRGSSLEAGVVSRIKMVSQLREMREVR